jgi:hypothetical protein
VSSIKDGFRGLGVLSVKDIAQTHRGVVLFNCVLDGKARPVALDYSDYPDFVNMDALADTELYFKCQFAPGGYGDDRIIPAGYPVTYLTYYKYLSAFRNIRSADIDVLGRFGFRFAASIRKKAVDLFDAAPTINFAGAGGKVRYSRFLREAASSRLCLHLPGNGPFTHRIAEFLGLGCCIISPPIGAELHVPLVPNVHYIQVSENLDDLVEKAQSFLANREERERIAKAGAEFFDKYLHCDQMAAYHLDRIFEHLRT